MEPIEIIITFVGLIVTATIAISQLHRTISIRRARLKHDLEMLKLTKDLGFPSGRLEKLLEEDINTFLEEESMRGAQKWYSDPEIIGMTIYGFAVLIGFGLWTNYLLRDGFTWWAVLTGFFAFGGIGQPFVAWKSFQKRKKAKIEAKHKTVTESA